MEPARGPSATNAGVMGELPVVASMSLTTMEPNPAWAAGAHAETVDVLAAHAEDLVFKVWGGDWCPDCRAQLPDFAAALDAAGVAEDRIEHYPVEKADDGRKVGPGVEAYEIELIPTVVVERVPRSDADGSSGERGGPGAADGEEIARFVEEASVPIADYLADEIESALGDVPADG